MAQEQEIDYGYIVEAKKDVFSPVVVCQKATANDLQYIVKDKEELKSRNESRLKELSKLEITNKKSLSGGDLIELILLRAMKKMSDERTGN